MAHTLYKIYYDIGLIYIGRTNQPLQSRLRGHFFKRPMHREIDAESVTRIEYAEVATEADMYVYEVYLINELKPVLNQDDKSYEKLTIALPHIEFRQYECKLMDKWKMELARQGAEKVKARYDRLARYMELQQKRIQKAK